MRHVGGEGQVDIVVNEGLDWGLGYKIILVEVLGEEGQLNLDLVENEIALMLWLTLLALAWELPIKVLLLTVVKFEVEESRPLCIVATLESDVKIIAEAEIVAISYPNLVHGLAHPFKASVMAWYEMLFCRVPDVRVTNLSDLNRVCEELIIDKLNVELEVLINMGLDALSLSRIEYLKAHIENFLSKLDAIVSVVPCQIDLLDVITHQECTTVYSVNECI
jgi:hypothetical protein